MNKFLSLAILTLLAPSEVTARGLFRNSTRQRSRQVTRCRFHYGGHFWDLSSIAAVSLQSEPPGGKVYFGTVQRNAMVLFQVCRNLRSRNCPRTAPVLVRLNDNPASPTICKRVRPHPRRPCRALTPARRGANRALAARVARATGPVATPVPR